MGCRSTSRPAARTLQPIEDLPAIRDADLTVHITGGTRQCQPRPRHRGGVARAQAQYRQRRVRNPGHAPQAAAGAHSFPHRRHGAGRGRAAGERRAARRRRAHARSRHQPRQRSPRRSRSPCRSARTRPTTPTAYDITADLTNFAADNLLMGQKVEALVAAGNRVERRLSDQRRRQDQRHAGQHRSAASQKATPNAELRLQATLDEAARRRLGIDLGSAVTGAIPVKLDGAARPTPTRTRR